MFDDAPLHDWFHDHVRTITDRHEDMDGSPFPSLAAAGDAVEADLTQLGIDWLYRAGLARKNGWGSDEGHRAVAQVVDVARAVAAEATERRWLGRR
ncbi:MAG: hypothetical protein OSB43_12755 [Nocardioides sp.]|uniref:hypothetical protein n=1 Tax=Nocardioides sp. TaxID=35761 RepID=UPI002385A78D|nr:hypothetical protein [Nocardioides sp.]MDE0777135.1 hypothetical protein [Nocardioides sp.]